MNESNKICNYNWRSKTILIAENSESCVYLLKEFFCNTNVKIIHSTSGLDAINICTQYDTKIDLIIVGMRLPDINGLKLAKAIKTLRNIPIVAYATLATMEDEQICIEEGFDYYMLKPVDLVVATENINYLLFKKEVTCQKNVI